MELFQLLASKRIVFKRQEKGGGVGKGDSKVEGWGKEI